MDRTTIRAQLKQGFEHTKAHANPSNGSDISYALIVKTFNNHTDENVLLAAQCPRTKL